MSDAGTAAAAATGTAAATTSGAWFDGYDADTKAHVTTRGWDKLPVNDAVAQAVKAHREAEKLIGVPAEQVVRWPKDANDKENWDKVYGKMGVPTDPKDYAFDGLKFANGTEPSADFLNSIRETAARLHLTKDAAKELVSDLLKSQDAASANATAAYEQKLVTERETLKNNWGANEASNKIIAQNAAQKLFSTMKPAEVEEAMASLEKTFGYANVMEMFRQIGTRIGEDRFVNREGTGTGALTAEEAQVTLDGLMRDTVWIEKFNKGDAQALAKFNDLTRLIAGGRGAR